MLYNRQALPLIKTKKINVFKNNKFSYGIDLSLSRISKFTPSEYKEKASRLDKRIKIVLVVLHTQTENYLAGFQSNAHRHNTLMQFKKENKSFVKEIALSDFINSSKVESFKPFNSTAENILEFSGTEIIDTPALTENEQKNIDNIHLLSFLMIQETDMSPAKYIYTKGANLEYDLILTRTTDGLLLPATVRKSFYTKSTKNPDKLIPYLGPAHYHSNSNPGPNGYIGWMAGHSQGKMGPLLEIREIPNYKIITEDDFYSYKAQLEIPEIPKAYAKTSQGSELIKHAKKEINFSKNITKQEIRDKITSTAKSTLEKDNKSFYLGFGNTTLHIASLSDKSTSADVKTSSDIKHRNYYGSVFGVDILSMVRYRSEYGPLITHHYEKSNMGIIREALNNSHIHKIEIKRKRLSNSADLKNGKGTFQHSEFDKKEKKIVSSYDRKNSNAFKNSLRRYRSADGEIQETALAAISPSGEIFDHPDCRYVRHFLFKDFDLFHNISDGIYTYEIELEFIDGMRVMLEKKYKNLKKRNLFFQKFVQKANLLQKPVSKGKTPNHDLKSFLKNPENAQIVQRAVRIYFEILRLIEGDNASKERIKTLENSVSPKNIDINTINKFADNLNIIESSFAILLKIQDQENVGKKSSSNLTGTFPGKIKETFKTGIHAKAFTESKLIADFSVASSATPVVNIRNLYKTLAKNMSKNYNDSFTPVDLKTVQGQKYQTIDKFSSRPGAEKTLTKFSATTIASAAELGTSGGISETNKKFKIAVLEQEDSEKRSLLNKGDLYYSHAVQQLGKGVKLKINGADFASPGYEATDSEKLVTSPELSSEVQKSIFNVSKKSESKDKILNEVEKEYKNIHNIRNKLGPIYEGMHSVFKVGEKIISSSSQDKIYENKYKGKNQNTRRQNQESMIDEYSAKLSVHLPGIYEQKINLSKLKILNDIQYRSNKKRYILMKLEGVFSKNILFSNNLFFVEV